MVINKLELLKQETGDQFIQLEENYFKGKSGDAIIVRKDELEDLIKIKSFEEIPFLPNELLQKYLPDIYKNELYLLETKHLAKYDYTILSNQIKDNKFFDSVLEFFDDDLSELIFSGAKEINTQEHLIFYLKNE